MSEVRFPVLPGSLSGVQRVGRYNQKPAPGFSGGDVFQRVSRESVTESATMSPLTTAPVRFGQSEALRKIFFPKSVAVIGASPDEGTIGRVVMDNMLGSGFSGTIYPVNPKATEVQGLAAYAGLDALPEVPDLVLVAVPGAAAVATRIDHRRRRSHIRPARSSRAPSLRGSTPGCPGACCWR